MEKIESWFSYILNAWEANKHHKMSHFLKKAKTVVTLVCTDQGLISLSYTVDFSLIHDIETSNSSPVKIVGYAGVNMK